MSDAPEPINKESARMARRIARLEATLQNVEQIRDTNSRLLDRLMGDLETERARSQSLLLNVLPQPIIDRLNAGEQLIADRYDDVAVVFSDFVGFTGISSRLPVADLVSSLNALFSAFDAACAALGVEKIKTIGDAYMAAAGLPGSPGDHIRAAADLADESVAVLSMALTDVLSDGLSMVYSFFEPSEQSRSLGTFMILDHITRARRQGLPYVYLGYWIEGSKKMDYKGRFLPQQRLAPSGWLRTDATGEVTSARYLPPPPD